MAGKDISFKITLDNGQFKVSSKAAQDALKKIGIESEVAGKKGETSTKSFSSSLGNLKASTIAAYGAVAGLAKGVYELSKAMVTNASKMQQNQVAFSTLLKSEEKATALLKELTTWAAKTPFAMEDATQGAKRLLAFGIASENITEVMTRLGDAAMGNAQTFDTLTLAYGKMASKGKVTLEELNMLTEAGVPIVDSLAKSYGVSTGELYKMIETGKVGFSEMEAALKDLTTGTGQFAGMMDQQSATLGGVWSTFKDTVSQTAGIAGQQLIPVLTETLLLLSDGEGTVGVLSDVFENLAYSIAAAGRVLNGFLKAYKTLVNSDKPKTYKDQVDEQIAGWEKQNYTAKAQIILLKEQIAEHEKYAKALGDTTVQGKEFAQQATIEKNAVKQLQDQMERERGGGQPGGGGRSAPRAVTRTTASGAAPARAAAEDAGGGWIGTPDYSSKSFTSGMLSETQSAMSQIDGIMQMATDNELARIDLRTQKKTDALNAEYQAEVERINGSSISQKEKDAKLKALDEKRARDQKVIDDKAAKDKRKIEHDAAKRKKAMDIINTVIAGAVGMIAAFQMGPIAGAVFAALIGALTAASVATIASQPLPPLATGTNYIPEDMPAQLHKGEAVIPAKFNSDEYIKKDQTQATNLTVYQTINLDGKEIGQNVEQYLLNRAANMNTGIYNNQG